MKQQLRVYGKTDPGERLRALLRRHGAAVLWRIGAFGAALVLAQGVVLRECAPFGLCAVGAAGSGTLGLAALLGAAAGYALLPFPVPGLLYLAASALCMAAMLLFYREGPCRRWLGPVCAAGSFAVVGGVSLVRAWSVGALALHLTQCAAIFAVAYLYGLLLHPLRPSRPSRALSTGRVTAVLCLCLTLLLPLSRVTLPLQMGLGRIAAGALTLAAGCAGGVGTGSAVGVLTGVLLEAALGRGYIGFCSVGGLIAGAGGVLPRPAAAALYALSYSVLCQALPDAPPVLGGVGEGALAALAVLLLPEAWLCRAGRRLRRGEESAGHLAALRETFSGRLRGLGRAFQEAGGQAAAALHRPTRREERQDVFQRAADRVCRRCSRRGLCWERDVTTTYNVCNDAAAVLLRDGRLEERDLPGYFSARCSRLTQFLSAVNEEYAAGRYRRQFGLRLEESRALLCQQYGEMARLLGSVAEEVRQEMDFQPPLEERVRRFLRFKGVRGDAVVYRGRHRRLYVRLQGTDLGPLTEHLEETRRELSALLKVRLGLPEQQIAPGEDRLLLREVERVRLQVEQAGSYRRGQKVSGDTGGAFRGEDGCFYVLLSDGMGSGEEAARQSAMAVRLLERFLRAGVDPQTAIRLLNSSLVLGNREDCSFVTVDLLRADLYTGGAELYKCGAAPSYFRRGDRVQRIPCETLPVGAEGPQDPAITRVELHLRAGDILLLQSDGVEEDEPWVAELLRRRSTAEGLAEDLLTAARARAEDADDMTAVAVVVKGT